MFLKAYAKEQSNLVRYWFLFEEMREYIVEIHLTICISLH